MNINL